MCDLMDCKDCRHLCKNEINDREVEKLWEEFEDVLFIEARDFYSAEDEYKNNITLVLASDWQGWKAGTSREDIWYWFDEHHSKGVGWLLNEYEF